MPRVKSSTKHYNLASEKGRPEVWKLFLMVWNGFFNFVTPTSGLGGATSSRPWRGKMPRVKSSTKHYNLASKKGRPEVWKWLFNGQEWFFKLCHAHFRSGWHRFQIFFDGKTAPPPGAPNPPHTLSQKTDTKNFSLPSLRPSGPHRGTAALLKS
jgi:hypothetical protein